MRPLTAAQMIVAGRKNVGTFWDIVRALAIDSNMQWCLDAADMACMRSEADQTWLNRGASSINWILGANTTPGTGDEPTFLGGPGNQSAYFYFDGGDNFLQTNAGGAQPAFYQRVHTDNALFAFGFWCYFAQITAINGLIGNFDGNASVRGSYLRITSSGTVQLLISNASGTYALNAESTRVVPRMRPTFIGVAVDEANGLGLFQIDGHQESFVSTYSSPSSGTYGSAIRVATSGTSATHRFQAGQRMYGWWFRESATVTPAEMMAFYVRSRRRFN